MDGYETYVFKNFHWKVQPNASQISLFECQMFAKLLDLDNNYFNSYLLSEKFKGKGRAICLHQLTKATKASEYGTVEASLVALQLTFVYENCGSVTRCREYFRKPHLENLH